MVVASLAVTGAVSDGPVMLTDIVIQQSEINFLVTFPYSFR
jgi:hypothetical protein